MTLRRNLEADGQWLFRHRGWLPLLVVAASLPVFVNHQYAMRNHDAEELWIFGCIALALAGQVLRFVTIAHVPSHTSGRNRKAQVAESLNTEGTYSIVRNPLYLGNCLSWLGLAAVPRSPWFWIAVALVFWLYHERVILAEEAFLEEKFGDTFRSWAAVTPAFFPRFRLWRPPSLPFSFRTALGREYVNLFILTTAFTALDGLADSIAERRPHLDPGWMIAWGVALVLFVVLRILKKRTRLFRIEGRDW